VFEQYSWEAIARRMTQTYLEILEPRIPILQS
jgi:hypothetical protein